MGRGFHTPERNPDFKLCSNFKSVLVNFFSIKTCQLLKKETQKKNFWHKEHISEVKYYAGEKICSKFLNYDRNFFYLVRIKLTYTRAQQNTNQSKEMLPVLKDPMEQV